MQFFTAVLALAGSASAAAFLPRSPMGSWHVQVTVDPDNSLYVTAPFHSDAYPDGLRNACVEDPNTTPPFHNCDHLEFDFSWDGKVMKVHQTINLPNKQTVFGEAELVANEDLGDGRFHGEATIKVSHAIA